jgi:hypothetical protein
MYGIDEDDLEFLQDSQAPVIEEEEGLRAAEVSNPSTIARMNALQSLANAASPLHTVATPFYSAPPSVRS